MEKIDLYNKISREIVKNYNKYLHTEDVAIFETLDTPEHFTISHVLSFEMAKKIHDIALQLKSIDDSLTINKPENYHITLFWKGLDSKLNEKTEEIKNIISEYIFEFEVEELLFGPKGISVKFYPKTESLVDARTELYNLTSTAIDINELFVTTWVSVATYTKIPKNEVKKYIQENASSKYGDYTADSFTLFISHNKGLDNPKVIEEFKCK